VRVTVPLASTVWLTVRTPFGVVALVVVVVSRE
jgi:hypothetical protein